MDRRIDLTLHNDFSPERRQTTQVITQDDFADFVDDMYNRKNMSNDEYEMLLYIESFFGRKHHFTEAINVFTVPDDEYIYKMRQHCPRCGKPLRVPWNHPGGLCHECNLQMDRERGYGYFFEGYVMSFGGTDDRGERLFSLR